MSPYIRATGIKHVWMPKMTSWQLGLPVSVKLRWDVLYPFKAPVLWLLALCLGAPPVLSHEVQCICSCVGQWQVNNAWDCLKGSDEFNCQTINCLGSFKCTGCKVQKVYTSLGTSYNNHNAYNRFQLLLAHASCAYIYAFQLQLATMHTPVYTSDAIAIEIKHVLLAEAQIWRVPKKFNAWIYDL